MTAHVVTKALFSPAAVRVLPFAVFLAFVMVSSMLATEPRMARTWDTRLLYVWRGVVVAVLLFALWRHYTELRVNALRREDWIVSLAVGAAVFVLWIALDQPWASMGRPMPFDPSGPDGSIDWILALPRLLGLALVVPVMEELFWRSFVMRALDQPRFLEHDPRYGSLRAFLLTALLFGLEHTLWLAGIVAGVAYGWVYRHAGNLWSPVVAHATTNTLLGLWVLYTRDWHLW
jgi:CAAX prenyl protease-like protein